MTRTCSVDGCEGRYHSLGLCRIHYTRQRRHGDPLTVLPYAWERQRAATHCKHGHPFDAANTRRDAQGHRHCRTCRRDRIRDLRTAYRAAGMRCDGKPRAEPVDYDTPTDHAAYTVAAVADVLAAGTSLIHLAGVYEAQAQHNLATWTPDDQYVAAAAAWRGDDLSVAAG